MKKILICILSALLVVMFVPACKSKPEVVQEEVETPAPAADAPDQASLDELNEAAARAEKARQMGIDFMAAAYYPEEWESADALFVQAESARNTSTLEETAASTARYNAAADALESVTGNALVQFAADLEEEVLSAREGAVRAGADKTAEDYLLQTDNVVAGIQELYDNDDYYGARDAMYLARDMYKILETALAACQLRTVLGDRDFVRFDPEFIEAADIMLESAMNEFEDGNIDLARSQSDSALAQYRDFRLRWIEVFTEEAAVTTANERQHALDLRANVASRQEFSAAEEAYNKAQALYKDGNFEEAVDLYNNALVMFEFASKLTLQKRHSAEEALREVDIRLHESDEAAHRAQLIIEGGAE